MDFQQQQVPRRSRLGAKDLVIRMLAEVFQVEQTLEGHLRWQQVSSSLVPISLYSRTTQRWLDWLLASGDQQQQPAVGAMSPDSRDFLRLLQQFHQRRQLQQQQGDLEPFADNLVVFQVVAHDYQDGQCRKVLNVKLSQPGTRLGQASDYFVYWKTGSSSINATCCQQQQLTETWGLNFASVNDARLFYDICSLNSVDLNFNSDYLRQLAAQTSDRRAHLAPDWEQQRIIRDFLDYKQRRLQQTSTPKKLYLDAKKQLTPVSKCPACSQMDPNKPATRRQNSASLRARSRSSTRQSESRNQVIPLAQQQHQQGDKLKRLRSFSTPPSPEPQPQPDPQCPVHQQQPFEHHPRCLSLMRPQKELLKEGAKLSGFRPKKPARGELRDFSQLPMNILQAPVVSGNQQQQQQSLLKRSSNSNNNNSNNRKNVKVPSKQSTTSETFRSQSSKESSLFLSREPTASNLGGSFSAHEAAVVSVEPPPANDHQDNEAMARFMAGKAAQRRSTGIDSHLSDQFHQRNAQLARAQYASSKSKFLSLDAGGQQATPNKLLPSGVTAASERFDPVSKTRAKASSELGAGSTAASEPIKGYGGANKNSNDAAQTTTVATTTDDLPMDPQTKKRMFRLTSDEVISERTEPSQLGGAGGDNQPRGDETQRAVSLGPPEVVTTRRDPGNRRRSLERSVRVDLGEQQQPQLHCLSPLIQSVTSLRDSSAKSSPSFARQNQQNNNNNNNNYSDNQLLPAGRRQQQQPKKKRARTKSYQETCSQASSGLRPPSVDGGGKCQHQHHQILSFKSAPDVSQLSPHLHHHHQQHHFVSPLYNPPPTTAAYWPPYEAQRPALGSYAVPLCSGGDLHPSGHELVASSPFRASHSCPNSLKRRGRLPAGSYCESAEVGQQQQQQQQLELQQRKLASLSYSHLNEPMKVASFCNCPYCHMAAQERELELEQLEKQQRQRQRRQQQKSLGRATIMGDNVNANNNNCAYACRANQSMAAGRHQFNPTTAGQECGNKSLGQQLHHRQQQQQQYINKPIEFRTYEKTLTSEPEAHSLYNNNNRPQSSQSSSKSPLHFGLYESDFEVDEEEEEEFLSNDDTCQRAPCCGGGAASFHRSSSGYFGPRAAATFRPVQGYDQTMARASLKSRQRARSQPPGSLDVEADADVEQAAECAPFNLTKSMENVRKLIREVQKELDKTTATATAKTTSGGGSGATATSHQGQVREMRTISIRAPPKGLRNSANDQQQQQTTEVLAANMSDEERNQQAGYQMPLADNNNNSTNWALKSGTSATRSAGQFKCTGAIRKAGFLSVKKWILKRRKSIELARKQGWKRYWVCLKGTALLFHSVIDKTDAQDTENHTDLLSWIQANCPGQMQMLASELCINDQSAAASDQQQAMRSLAQCYIEREPKHLIIVEAAIAQPIPEHPRRDFVFCLSTTFGDAYLFQASCQLESDNWISAIHNACAASIARHLTRDEAIKLFETKIRHLELEAEKKLFLRQRLESRLTSMSSISHINPLMMATPVHQQPSKSPEEQEAKTTMRSLLYRLSQQLQTLDTYLEQIHCEIYQLRCYLSSCGHQQLFYQALQQEQGSRTTPSSPAAFMSIDLPHPKSLLMHVTKSTKLTLIKLGVFTVSSFHAFVHARQSSADTILQKIKSQPQQELPLIELRVRSQSISEKLLASRGHENVELEQDTEQLIHLSDLRRVPVRVNRKLFDAIRGSDNDAACFPQDSDDRYSFQDGGDHVLIILKLHQSSSSMSIIKQLLQIIEPANNSSSLVEHLNYYLQFSPLKVEEGDRSQYIVKRRETLADWSNFEYLELNEKVLFKVQLTRKRMDEDTSPFGISIGAQLFTNELESLLNVYCSYIEWGSVADKAGLKDEDELLVINGVPMMDLDMMFVECIIHDESSLRLVVRSSRADCPPQATQIDKSTWSPPSNQDPDQDHSRLDEDGGDGDKNNNRGRLLDMATSGSQIISDEYISTLVCPPPPSHSEALLKTMDTTDLLLRQKSDLSLANNKNAANSRLVSSATNPNLQDKLIDDEIDKFVKDELELIEKPDKDTKDVRQRNSFSGSELLASQLLTKTQQLSRLLGKNHWKALGEEVHEQVEGSKSTSNQLLAASPQDPNIAQERLKRSILELFETEYAFIKQLETIREQYMAPLEESNYLDIPSLKHLNRALLEILIFQREFFYKLTSGISEKYQWSTKSSSSTKLDEDYEELNKIVERVGQFEQFEDFKPLLKSLLETFLEESDKFRIYSAYCVKYSNLQKFLHPQRDSSQQLPPQTLPTQLDTFFTSSALANGSNSHHTRDFLKPLSSFMSDAPPNDQEAPFKLKQLNEFLGNLDSSSSSASLSLTAKSSLSTDLNHQLAASQEPPKKISLKNPWSSQSAGGQKSVHQQNLESYLIKPIQRIVKYPMLLNSIAISAQLCSGHNLEAEGADLEVVVRRMSSITSLVNDTQRVYDEWGQNFKLIESQFLKQQQAEMSKLAAHSPSLVVNIAQQTPISLEVEHLLHFGQVNWLNIHEFNDKLKRQVGGSIRGGNLINMVFVFDSCVVIIAKEQVVRPTTLASKKKIPSSKVSSNLQQSDVVNVIRYQSLIPVKEVQVRSVPFTSSTTNHNPKQSETAKSSAQHSYLWEMFRCSSVNSNSSLLAKSSRRRNAGGKIYLLASPTNEARQAILRRIRFIIRESVRNMSLPSARSPSVKSLTPKKLSSPSSNTNTNSSCSQSTSLSPVVNCKRVELGEECKLTTTKVDGSYTTSIEVNN